MKFHQAALLLLLLLAFTGRHGRTSSAFILSITPSRSSAAVVANTIHTKKSKSGGTSSPANMNHNVNVLRMTKEKIVNNSEEQQQPSSSADVPPSPPPSSAGGEVDESSPPLAGEGVDSSSSSSPSDVLTTTFEEPSSVIPGTTTAKRPKSQALPFLDRPEILDGTFAGDVGFDPFGFARSQKDLIKYREAEIKHARLAMLAAAGWPISELLDKQIASAFNLPPILDATDRAPSLLNGGLGKISPLYWVVTILAAAAIDYYGIQRSKSNDPDYFPGNLGFDPFGWYPKDADAQKYRQLAEIKNGRLAMIAIVAFAVQEFVYKLGVVDETPIFFKPANAALQEYANTGYLAH